MVWFGPTPLIGDLDWSEEALFEMDRWLTAVEADRRAVTLSRKVVDGKPDDLTDRCQNAPSAELSGTPGEPVCTLPALQTDLGTPRQVAGGPVANDTLACRLRPLDRSDYQYRLHGAGRVLPVPFTDAQWSALERVFADGVCAWPRPGRGHGPATTWLTYLDSNGGPVYGGRELPAPPQPSGTGWSSPTFRSLLRR